MWKKYKKPILAGVVILAVLAAAFFLGGSPEKGTTQGNAGNTRPSPGTRSLRTPRRTP